MPPIPGLGNLTCFTDSSFSEIDIASRTPKHPAPFCNAAHARLRAKLKTFRTTVRDVLSDEGIKVKFNPGWRASLRCQETYSLYVD
jgi:hypothetical protein